MPHDPEKVAECRGWLDRAWADIDSAAILLASDRPRPDTALFHRQEAIEKDWSSRGFFATLVSRRRDS